MNSEIVRILEAAYPARPDVEIILPMLERIVTRIKSSPKANLTMGAEFSILDLIEQVETVGLFDGDTAGDVFGLPPADKAGG